MDHQERSTKHKVDGHGVLDVVEAMTEQARKVSLRIGLILRVKPQRHWPKS